MPDRDGEVREKVKETRIVVLHVAGPMVAQKVIELRFGFGKIHVPTSIYDVNTLPDVGVVEAEMVFLFKG